MNSSGIIRRMDELGRIVIPVEVRKLLNIKVGDSLEFTINNGVINLGKKSYIKSRVDDILPLVKVLESVIKCNCILTDRQNILYSSDKKYEGMNIPESISSFLNIYEEMNVLPSINELDIKVQTYLFPYSIDSNVNGFICIYNVDKIENYTLLIKFVCKYIEDLFSLT